MKTDIFKIIFFTTLIISATLFNGCKEATSSQKYTPVVRVFMHNPGEYSFLYQEGKELKSYSFQWLMNGNKYYKIFTDVENGSPMWAEIIKIPPRIGNDEWYMNIHIHNSNEINGGNFRNGKNNGQTIEVE